MFTPKWYDWMWAWLPVAVLLGLTGALIFTFNLYWYIAVLCLFIGVHSGMAQRKLYEYYMKKWKEEKDV